MRNDVVCQWRCRRTTCERQLQLGDRLRMRLLPRSLRPADSVSSSISSRRCPSPAPLNRCRLLRNHRLRLSPAKVAYLSDSVVKFEFEKVQKVQQIMKFVTVRKSSNVKLCHSESLVWRPLSVSVIVADLFDFVKELSSGLGSWSRGASRPLTGALSLALVLRSVVLVFFLKSRLESALHIISHVFVVFNWLLETWVK